MKRKKRFQSKYRDESYKDITDNKLGIKFNIHKLMKMELFMIIVNAFQPLTVITKSSTLDVASVLDPPLPVKHSFFMVQKQSTII